ncbi:E2 protein [Human papillomavirus 116]|uniref:Regulatory protein E2 n=1 Tax=Human papillomavirus 116 TaxID=915428 RepID=C7B7D5_9PAPI|nr:E2 protein [Human papillomavirus 116]ACT76415.1 E2 protein [Human papillomavirus 116]
MNQSDLTERLDALQTALMNIYEEAPTDLPSQIRHFDLLRKQSVLEYYVRKEGYTQLGLYHIPTLKVSEYHAKEAIKMGIVLRSLQKSPYADEEWSLQDVNADFFNSPPRNCFKKGGYDVEVWFDHNPLNTFPYTNWTWIYYQDDEENWHKVQGETDYNGLFYRETDGTVVYFLLFESDAARYGTKNEWTVNVKNEQISLPANSNGRRSSSGTPTHSTTNSVAEPGPSRSTEEADGRRTPQAQTQSVGASKKPSSVGRRRRRKQGKQTPSKRRRTGGGSGDEADSGGISAEEVGSSHRSVARSGLSRLERLQKEARDPYIILVRGPQNTLKCWRYRIQTKANFPFLYISTVWKWVTKDAVGHEGRVLIAFLSKESRDLFANSVHFPKNTTHSYGSLDAL